MEPRALRTPPPAPSQRKSSRDGSEEVEAEPNREAAAAATTAEPQQRPREGGGSLFLRSISSLGGAAFVATAERARQEKEEGEEREGFPLLSPVLLPTTQTPPRSSGHSREVRAPRSKLQQVTFPRESMASTDPFLLAVEEVEER